jgi:dihydroneopterin aldolase
MTDPNLQYVVGPKGDPGQDAEPVNYTVVNSMVNQILVSNPALKGVKGDQGNSATDAQVAAAVQAYLSANEEVFKGADGVSPVLDYSQIITDIEAWMQTDAIKPIFTGDAANVDTSALQTSIINAIKVYMDENPNQFKGVDGTSPSINYTTVIEGIKTWMTSSPEVISIFRGATGSTGLPAPAPDPIDYNIVKMMLIVICQQIYQH